MGGHTWHAHTPADFQNALNSSSPGDIIVLDAGSVYSGNFVVPEKANPERRWIYIESSQIKSLPAPGSRVGPGNAPNMPTITTPNASAAILFNPGANYVRLAGLHVTSSSTYGGNPGSNPPSNNWCYYLIQANSGSPSDPLVSSVTDDRVLVQGSDTEDVNHGVDIDGKNMAIVDSYISDIHMQGFDSQGVLATSMSPGPYKIVDNYVAASTEDVFFGPEGGLGNQNNPYISSDIEIRKNYLTRPLAWDKCGALGTIPAGGLRPNGTACPASVDNQWVEKNDLEFKEGRRAVVTGNILDNTWVSGQVGWALVLTARVASASNLWISDILIQDNILRHVDRGINTLEQDTAPGETYAGYNKRVEIYNNLIVTSTIRDSTHWGMAFDGGAAVQGYGNTYGLTDYIVDHNTMLERPGAPLYESGYFELPSYIHNCQSVPPVFSSTHNVWILNNVLTNQTSGDCGFGGISGLTHDYFGDPPPVAPRFYGNVLFVPSGEGMQSWPPANDATTTPFTYVSPADGNYQLVSPHWTDTTDGTLAGINWKEIRQAINGKSNPPAPRNSMPRKQRPIP